MSTLSSSCRQIQLELMAGDSYESEDEMKEIIKSIDGAESGKDNSDVEVQDNPIERQVLLEELADSDDELNVRVEFEYDDENDDNTIEEESLVLQREDCEEPEKDHVSLPKMESTQSVRGASKIKIFVFTLLFWLIVGAIVSGAILGSGDNNEEENETNPEPSKVYSGSSTLNYQPLSTSISSNGDIIAFPAHDNETEYVMIGFSNELKNITIGEKSTEKLPLALSGNGGVLAYSTINSVTNSSNVYVLKYINESWSNISEPIIGFEGELTLSLSHNGRYLAVGESMYSNNAGKVTIYALTSLSNVTDSYTDNLANFPENNVHENSTDNDLFDEYGDVFEDLVDSVVNSSDEWLGEVWVNIKTFEGSAGARTGNSVSLHHTINRLTIAIGSFESDLGIGSVKIYRYNIFDDIWSQLGSTLVGSGAENYFGVSVSLSFHNVYRVAIGASGYGIDNNARVGQCQIYEHFSSEWIKVGNSINGENSNAELGYQVSLSGDGSRVAVSSKEPSLVKIYQLLGGVNGTYGDWSLILEEANEENIAGFGNSVKMNSDGTKLAVGAEGNDNEGLIYLYEFDSIM